MATSVDAWCRCGRGVFVPDESGVWCSFCGAGQPVDVVCCAVGHVQQVALSAWKDRRQADTCGVVVATRPIKRLCLAPLESILSDSVSEKEGEWPPIPPHVELAAKLQVSEPQSRRKSLTARRKTKREYQRDYMRTYRRRAS